MINIISYSLIFIMTVLGAIAGFYLKKSSSTNGIIELILNKYLYIGALLYLFSALINIYVLKILDYSVVLPLTSITYIWTMIISYFLLHEKITSPKIIGVMLIIIGAIFIAFS